MYKTILKYLNEKEDKMALQPAQGLEKVIKNSDILTVEYTTAEDKSRAEKANTRLKHVILLDINALPSEYKGDKEGLKKYEEDFNVSVIPYDTSKVNTQGSINGRVVEYLGRE